MTLLELYNFAEKEGIEVDYYPMNEVTAVSFPNGWIALNSNKIKTSIEEKACLAHELGHCMTGCFYNINTNYNIRTRCECRANRWAIKKLVPKKELKEVIKSGIKDIWELADYFDVSESFIIKAIEYYKIRKDDGK